VPGKAVVALAVAVAPCMAAAAAGVAAEAGAGAAKWHARPGRDYDARMSRVPFDPMKSAAHAGGRRQKRGGAALTDAAAGSAHQPLTISQANTLLAHALAAALPAVFFVQGEISNFRTYDRGHAFFTLKDAAAELPCILWKDALARLKFKPRDGLAVIARGAVRLYEPQGRIQLYVETMWPQGAGALELAFRQLCEKLRQEGLFELARKRPLPRLPRHVAVITSRTGDVLHDVLTTAWRRFPGLHVSLLPVRVQANKPPRTSSAPSKGSTNTTSASTNHKST